MDNFKSGYVAVAGRPNVGKSTLINNIMGEKLSIVSKKPQTTRNNIQAILNREDCQIIFIDTPGMHSPRHKLGEYMVRGVQRTFNEVDLIYFITNPSDKINQGDLKIIENFKKTKAPVFLILNKIDISKKEETAKTISNLNKIHNFEEVIPISAKSGENIDELLNLTLKYLPYGPKYYPEDMITDQQERFIVSEIIREKLLNNLEEEVPHGTAVEIISFKENEEKNLYEINATIYCEKDSHKAIIIGKNGSMLKKVGSCAREEIEKFLMKKVYLELWVKVKKDWRDDVNVLKSLGYK